MTIHGELFAGTAAPLLLDHFGQEGNLYVTADGTPAAEFDAIVTPERAEEQQTVEGTVLRYVRELKIPRQEGLPFWDDTPSSYGRVWVGNVQYAIDVIEAVTESFVYLRLVRVGVAEGSRPAYRRK